MEITANTSTIVVTDFDGTAARDDVQVSIMQTFTGDEWLKANQIWDRGELTTAQRARAQWDLLRERNVGEEALHEVIGRAELDPYFPELVTECRKRNWPVVVASDGFDYYITPILERAGLSDLPVYCNSLICSDGEYRMNFRSETNGGCGRCGNCKRVIVEQLRAEAQSKGANPRIVFIGDGNADRCGAEVADLIFAKRKLRTWCEQNGVEYIPFETMADVAAVLFAPGIK